MAIMMTITLSMTLVNIIILMLLAIISVKNYKKIKAQFNLGLLIFVMTFLIQKIFTFYVYFSIMVTYQDVLGKFLLAIEGLQLVAFVVYYWMTNS